MLWIFYNLNLVFLIFILFRKFRVFYLTSSIYPPADSVTYSVSIYTQEEGRLGELIRSELLLHTTILCPLLHSFCMCSTHLRNAQKSVPELVRSFIQACRSNLLRKKFHRPVWNLKVSREPLTWFKNIACCLGFP